ncbi:MAG: hypothetical protein KIT69_19155, partial [Propionibacteriaceae bacterium]|nr:hypothetical protein [Propionibacteriaceae bacterium]
QQCRALEEEFGAAEHLRRAGNRIDPFYVTPKAMWLRDNEPTVLREAAALLQIPGYLVRRVTGEFSLDNSHASILGLGQPNEWDERLLGRAGIDPRQLPVSVAGSTIVGYSLENALPGLPAGVPVAAGTVDSAAAALEVDLGPNEALLMTGTSSVLVMPRAERSPCPEFISMALADGGWCDLAAVVSSGASVSWLTQLAGLDLASFMELAAQSVPGAHGLVVLPYLAGERSPWWDTAARGGFVGLTVTHALGDLARAVLEGTALSLRQNLAIALEAGHDIRRLAANGGPARNALWNQITSDVTGLPIVSHNASGGSAFGCCRLAARSVGAQMPALCGARVETTPSNDFRTRYDELSAAYDALYPALRETTRRLARLTEE